MTGPGIGTEVEGLLRSRAPRVLGAVVRRYGHFDTAEDAVQEALVAAATRWPDDGVPDNPRAWLITVAARRLTDLLRAEQARRRREDAVARWALPDEWTAPPADRLSAVLHVLYLIFNEGYASTGGPGLYRVELSAEAIRLTRIVHRLLPDEGEVAGLLALMLLNDARRPARTGPDGALIPMAEQDRSLWNADAITEGEALPRGPTGPYQLQAAIAAVHDEAPSAEDTDWPQILALYELLLQIDSNPV